MGFLKSLRSKARAKCTHADRTEAGAIGDGACGTGRSAGRARSLANLNRGKAKRSSADAAGDGFGSKKDAARTEPGASKPKGKRQQRPAMGAVTLEQARTMIRGVLSAQGPKTPKELAALCQMADWKVSAALKDWAEVEHTNPASYKSPYRLKPS